jgi:DNA-binding transcriptional regulator YiaG
MRLWRFAPAGLRDAALLRGTTVARSRGMPDSTRTLIRTLRQQLGMTQEEFAHEIAVTVSTVNRWENAHAEPSKLAWKAIRDLAQQRGVPTTSTASSTSY